MSIKEIKIKLLAVPAEKVAGAYNKYCQRPMASYSKAQQAEWLANQINMGTLIMSDVVNFGATYTVGAPVPAFEEPKATTSPLSDALGRHDQEIKSIKGAVDSLRISIENVSNLAANSLNALPSRAKIDALESVTARTEAEVLKHGEAIAGVAIEVTKLAKQIKDVPVPQEIDATIAVNTAVANAFKQFKESLAPAEAEAAAAKVDGLVIDRKPALDVFGVDVRDVKGRPVMVDIYNHPDSPAIDPDFIWTKDILEVILLAQDTGDNIWCGGERGTGKSETAKQFAACTGRNYVRMNFQKHTTVDDIAGGTGLVNGSTEFVPSAMLQGYMTPSTVVLLDEPTNADNAVLAFLNGLLERNSAVSVGGAVRRRAAGVMVFAADNTLGAGDATGNYLGLKTMNVALMDRFSYKPEFQFLPPSVESAALQKRTGCNQALADHVVAAWGAMRGKVATGDIICAPSIRGAMAFIKACARLKPVDAWQLTVVNGSAEESVPALQAIFSACIDSVLIEDNV